MSNTLITFPCWHKTPEDLEKTFVQLMIAKGSVHDQLTVKTETAQRRAWQKKGETPMAGRKQRESKVWGEIHVPLQVILSVTPIV